MTDQERLIIIEAKGITERIMRHSRDKRIEILCKLLTNGLETLLYGKKGLKTRVLAGSFKASMRPIPRGGQG